MGRKPAADLNFTVELWSDDEAMLLETLATTSIWAIAKAALVEAGRRYPGKLLLVRQGIRVVFRAGAA